MKIRLITLIMLITLGSFAHADVAPTRVSEDAAGNKANNRSFSPSVSADGRLVAFASSADNLVVGDTNNESDVFLKNIETGEIVLVNENAGAPPVVGFRDSAKISLNGRFVAYTSGSIDNQDNREVNSDVFVKNLETGAFDQVNVYATGVRVDQDAYNPSINADGRLVAFESSEITSGSGGDIFVKDLTTGRLRRVNEDQAGNPISEFSSLPKISADGSTIVFEGFVINPTPILTLWAKNLVTGELVAINQDIVGQQRIRFGTGHSVSADGKLVAFTTTAPLVPTDTNDARDAFVKNLETGEINLINTNTAKVAGDGGSEFPYISADGNFVVFQSKASNLIAGDNNSLPDVFIKNLSNDAVVRIISGVGEFDGSFDFSTSANGQLIVFESKAIDLVPGGTSENSGIFLIDTGNIAPTTPGNLRFVVRSAMEADLSWDQSSDNGDIVEYEVTRNGEVIELGTALSLSQANLQSGVVYTFTVTAIDNDGNRSATASIAFTTDGTAPTKPDNLRFQLYSDTAAEIFWDRSSDNKSVQGYEIMLNGKPLGVRDVLSIFDGNLAPGTVYNYSVTAIDDDGIRSSTATISFTTDGIAPDRPDNLRYQVYSNTAAEIFWNRSMGTYGVQGYEVVRNGELLGVRDSLSLFDDQLVPGLTYTYAVTAIDTDGNRSPTALATLLAYVDSQPPPTGPSKPEKLRSLVYSNTAAEIFWDRSSDNGIVQGYELVRNGEIIGIFDAQSFFEDDLEPGITYTYDVTAIDNDGNRSATATTSLLTAQAKPFPLRATVYSATAAELFWDRPQAVGLVYEISRNGVVIDLINGVSFFDDQLNTGTTYNYQVTAIDPSGRRSESAAITLSTLSDG